MSVDGNTKQYKIPFTGEKTMPVFTTRIVAEVSATKSAAEVSATSPEVVELLEQLKKTEPKVSALEFTASNLAEFVAYYRAAKFLQSDEGRKICDFAIYFSKNCGVNFAKRGNLLFSVTRGKSRG